MAIKVTDEFKEKVYKAMIEQRHNFDGTNGQFAKIHGLSASIFSRIHNGERDGVLSDAKWLMLGHDFGIQLENRRWVTARTEVFDTIEEDILFCKNYSKSRICVDDCGIGKTYTARYLSRQIKNCFYVDASQGKTKHAFIKLMAKSVGADFAGRHMEVKRALKYHLQTLHKPIFIIDEAGDLEYNAFLELKEIWNATEHYCGFYLMGADGLRAKIERGISNRKVGYAEIFSRYSEKFTTIVPKEPKQRNQFYRKLITDTLTANSCPPDKIDHIVRRCMANDNSFIGGLRRAESLLILNS